MRREWDFALALLLGAVIVAFSFGALTRLSGERPPEGAAGVAAGPLPRAEVNFDDLAYGVRWGDAWSPFANPVAADPRSLVIFHEYDGRAKGWRVDLANEIVAPINLGGLSLGAHDAVSTAEGIWLIGPDSALITPDDVIHSREGVAGERRVVPLNSGGILVFPLAADGGVDQALSISRIASTNALRFISKAPLARRHGSGFAAAALADGRVMVAGGRGSEFEVDLYDPEADAWLRTSPLLVGAGGAVLVPLPDGRVVAAGGASASVPDSHRAEIWNPRDGTWKPLPNTPLTLGGPVPIAGAVLPDGAIVFGGNADGAYQVLRPDGQGWASTWRVVGVSGDNRVGGSILALDDHAIAAFGGFNGAATPRECCRRQSGIERVRWSIDEGRSDRSLALMRREPIFAGYGGVMIVAGGWNLERAGTSYSALVELVDLRNGSARQLAPFPEPIGVGKAIWLDENRVLVKGAGFGEKNDAYMPVAADQSGAPPFGLMALYDRPSDRWMAFRDRRLANAELVGIGGTEAIFFRSDQTVFAVDLSSFVLRELPARMLARNGVVRVLPDGRIIVAGGDAPSHVVSAIDPDCDIAGCPERFVGFGSHAPADWYEWFDPGSGTWKLSAASNLRARSAVILRDGSVVKTNFSAGLDHGPSTEGSSRYLDSPMLIQKSSTDGKSWTELPIPPGLHDTPLAGAECRSDIGMNSCRLLLGSDQASGAEHMFFMHVGQIDRYWVWDGIDPQWRAIGRVPDGGSFPTLTYSVKASPGSQTVRWRATLFDEPPVVIWKE